MSLLQMVRTAYAPWITGLTMARSSDGDFPSAFARQTLTVGLWVGWAAEHVACAMAAAAATLAQDWPFWGAFPLSTVSIFLSRAFSHFLIMSQLGSGGVSCSFSVHIVVMN